MYIPMNQANMTLNLFKRLFDQPPPGFQPGVTLGRALAELRGRVEFTKTDVSKAVLHTIDGNLNFEVQERVERHFMMHIVALKFTQNVPSVAVPGARIDVRNTGLLFRTGMACATPARYRRDLQPIIYRLEGDRELAAALMALDFRRCQVLGTGHGWCVCIEPYGASEVVNRMPSFRRYIRLEKSQGGALVAALQAFRRILGTPPHA